MTETGPVTLTVWDQETGAVSRVWDRLNAEFEQKYPNVTIKRVNRDFGELKTLLKLAISGPHAPDVVEANQGWPDMGQLVKAGLLLPLDNYAKAYGWEQRVSENVRAVSSWTPDGKEFGTGNLYGYTTMGEILGVYYNKATAREPGACGADDVRPVRTGPRRGQAGGHPPGPVRQQRRVPRHPRVHGRAGPDGLGRLPDRAHLRTSAERALVRHAGERAGSDHLQNWAKAGYFTPGFGGGGYDTAVANFAKGQGLFMITGNWIVANLGADNDNFGFFLMPPEKAGDPPVSTGGAGFPLAITSASKHPDVAAAYIDWMNSDHASDLLVPTGELPLRTGASTSAVQPGTVLADVVHAADTVSRANGVVPYEDWATPTFYDTLTAAVQELMGNRITPQQFVAQVQKDYADFQSSRR